MSFHVGQKVVCVDNSTWEHRLSKNAVYTISAIGPAHGEMYVGLAETTRPGSHPLHWRAARFRPLIERKTDISVFTALLTPARKRELVTSHMSGTRDRG